jgi:hypothetical protein
MLLDGIAKNINDSIINWIPTNKNNFENLIEEVRKYFA